MALRTDYKNDVLNTSVNEERRFEEVTNPDGSKSYRDVTDYSQVGDNFDADLVNIQNAEINAKAPIDSPAFTGTPTAPTQSQSTSDDTLATTAFVKAALTNAIDLNLRTSGKAADAKATGDKLNSIQESVPTVDTTLKTSGAAADAKVTGDSVRSILNALVSETTTEAQVASCYDAAGEFPIKRLVANIIPKQDFNGYDHPWAGGAGKNILPVMGNTATSGGITYTYNDDGTVTATGTATGNITSNYGHVTLPAGTYLVSGCTGGSTTKYRIRLGKGSYIGDVVAQNYDDDTEFTLEEATDVYARLYVGVAAGENVNLTFKPMIRRATEIDPTYEPYANICPISGYTGVTVTRAGKNLLTNIVQSVTKNGITMTRNADGTLTFNGTATAATAFYVGNVDASPSGGFTALKPDTTYILSGCPTGGAGSTYLMRLYYFNGETATGENIPETGTGAVFTVPSEGVDRCRVAVRFGNNITVNNLTFRPQLEIADTATEYEPYSGATCPVTFPTAAGTVYGGTLTVNSDGSGTLTVDRMYADLGNLNWSYSSKGYFTGSNSTTDSTIKHPESATVLLGVLCSHYTEDTSSHIYKAVNDNVIGVRNTTGSIWVRDTSKGTDAAAFKTAMDGVQFVYPVVTPTTYALSAVQVVQMLAGLNNIWTDAAGTVSGEYYASTALYVQKIVNAQKGMIAGVEADMTASKNYAIGDLMIVGDALYKATAAISSGVSLVIGTNITQTTVAEQLIALAKA